MSKQIVRKLAEKLNLMINELDANGRKWIGYDGLLNMETFALTTLFFMIFFKAYFAAGFSLIMVLIKCYTDKKKGHFNEKHDLICAGIGIVFGCIIGLALAL
jgi:hypothetical protein